LKKIKPSCRGKSSPLLPSSLGGVHRLLPEHGSGEPAEKKRSRGERRDQVVASTLGKREGGRTACRRAETDLKGWKREGKAHPFSSPREKKKDTKTNPATKAGETGIEHGGGKSVHFYLRKKKKTFFFSPKKASVEGDLLFHSDTRETCGEKEKGVESPFPFKREKGRGAG